MRRNLHVLFIVAAAIVGMGANSQRALATTNESSCNSGATFAVGSGYTVQNNAYNLQNGGQQCIYADSNGTDWYVTTTNSVATDGEPGAYPSIYAGCHWGVCSANQQGMPMLESSITTAPTAWNVTPSSSGNWDNAYDIWFNPDSTTNNNSSGLELMVWINHMGTIQPAGSVVASDVSINGMTWNIWSSQTSENTGTISYVATSGVTSVNFDLVNFFHDLVDRGYLSADQYLIDVEAGTEIWTPGSNFNTNSFFVSVSSSPACDAVPEAPVGLSATTYSSAQINLSWSGVTPPANCSITGYNIYRSTVSGFTPGSGNLIAGGVTGTTYSNTGLAASTTYYYVVEAVDSYGSSPASSQASATTSSASGLCYSGSDCLEGTLPATANYSNIYQVPAVTANSTYVASFWIQGTGSVQLYIDNGDWGSNLVLAPECTATSSWTQCTTAPFSTGSNTQLSYIIQDTYGGAGTVYIDNAFMGVSGGTNVLANPGFESGNVDWTNGSATTWAIIESGSASCSAVPSAPTGLTATASSSSVIGLTWTAVTPPANCTISGYNVYRSTTSGFTPGSVNLVASGLTSPSYSNTGLASSTTYYFVVEAVDAYGTSAASAQASATTQAPPSGNCYTGTACLEGTLPATANYSNMNQVVSVVANSTYVASLWIKGTGSVQLYLDNGNWGSNLISVECTATSTYSQCTTAPFSTGSNTQLTYIIQDSYGGAGTVYIDSAFLGVSGGTNRLANPNFTSLTSWDDTNASTWSIY